MEKSKKNPFLICIYAVVEFFSLCLLGLGTLIVLILSGIFLGALHVRNLFRRKTGKYNKRP